MAELYSIHVTEDAAEDLKQIRNYIADVLLAPAAARSLLRALREEIGALSTLPERFALVQDEPWHTRGLRRVPVKNFIIYYRVDHESRRVYILNIIYSRRDQLRQLAQMHME